ncbi:MAG: cytoplasmic protein [Thermoprotei archaeon]|nr:MAG: cytoplasmic protein [Thermoprotei archaeon]
MVRVLYAGDAGVVIGPIIFETPFIIEIKDAYVRDWSHYLINAVKEVDPEISFDYIHSIHAYRRFPRKYEDLKKYDVIILSDVSSEVLAFYPEFFPIEELREVELLEKHKYVGMPNRLKLIKRFVEEGGGFLMGGGWYSFSGRFGQGAWYDTPVAEVLPVKISRLDDRVEAPDGAFVKVVDKDHPVTRGLPWETCPPFLGYNKVEPKDYAKVLAVIGESGDPFIVVGEYGEGRVMAFTSDPVLHWGINFIKWKYYGKFWAQTLRWLAKKD